MRPLRAMLLVAAAAATAAQPSVVELAASVSATGSMIGSVGSRETAATGAGPRERSAVVANLETRHHDYLNAMHGMLSTSGAHAQEVDELLQRNKLNTGLVETMIRNTGKQFDNMKTLLAASESLFENFEQELELERATNARDSRAVFNIRRPGEATMSLDTALALPRDVSFSVPLQHAAAMAASAHLPLGTASLRVRDKQLLVVVLRGGAILDAVVMSYAIDEMKLPSAPTALTVDADGRAGFRADDTCVKNMHDERMRLHDSNMFLDTVEGWVDTVWDRKKCIATQAWGLGGAGNGSARVHLAGRGGNDQEFLQHVFGNRPDADGEAASAAAIAAVAQHSDTEHVYWVYPSPPADSAAVRTHSAVTQLSFAWSSGMSGVERASRATGEHEPGELRRHAATRGARTRGARAGERRLFSTWERHSVAPVSTAVPALRLRAVRCAFCDLGGNETGPNPLIAVRSKRVAARSQRVVAPSPDAVAPSPDAVAQSASAARDRRMRLNARKMLGQLRVTAARKRRDAASDASPGSLAALLRWHAPPA